MSVFSVEVGKKPTPTGRCSPLVQALPPPHFHAPQGEAQFIKDFKHYGPPTFDGGSEKATASEEWVRELEAFYVYLGCADQFKVKGAVFMLRGEALNWWDSIATAEDLANVPITDCERYERSRVSPSQYERKFTELSCFALEFIPTEAVKIKRFFKGLRKGIRAPVDLQPPASYAEAVRGALIMDKDVTSKAQPLLEVSSSSGVKRNYADQPFRVPQYQAQ
ncbi:uncharacterized protein LOC111024816 [Momordica charantia]|uniref:Uncharacterized protein LOC111024816 n=1 Tax=Momordica charantia TaxID=3673 RepID=A0A6J1DWW5_MOMCH|nr:uncharacterized protein LOC111024816 [Momordica charantia]